MKDNYQNLNLSKLRACDQYWSKMQETSEGRLCSKCSNEIYDFRNKSKAEIAIIHARTQGRVCGLYTKNQLKSKEGLTKVYKKRHFINPAFYTIFALFLNKESEAKPLNEGHRIETSYEIHPDRLEKSTHQKQIQAKKDSSFITGQVKIEEDTGTIAQPGINILIEGTDIGTSSDLDGNFILQVPNEISGQDSISLIFKFIGYRTKKVTVDSKTKELDVILSPDDMQISEFYIYAKPPLHKRIWFWLTGPFRN